MHQMDKRQSAVRASRAVILAGVLASTCAVPAFAQSMQHAQTSPADREFVTNMLQESRGQLALAHLATARATSAEASSAAAQTISEWSSLRSRLNEIAYAQGAPIRGTLDGRERTVLQRLGRTQPARFDQAFLNDVQRGNATALNRMKREKATQDPAVRRFISFADPIVSSDEQMTSDDLLGRHSLPG